MKKKIVCCCCFLLLSLFSCKAVQKQSSEKQLERFGGSRLAAQVFNRWQGDQKEAEGTRLEVLDRVHSEQIQKIHGIIGKVRNKY